MVGLPKNPKVLLLHPFMNYYGGAEYMLNIVANEMFPQADIFTLAYNPQVVKEAHIAPTRVTTPVHNLFHTLFRSGTVVYPALIDTLQPDPSYDLVVSLSYAYVHGVVTSHVQPHISYIHSPMRLLWMNESEHYGFDKVPLVREVYRTILASQRNWDMQAATRPDYLVSSSTEVANRVRAFWGRESQIIYPPVDVDFYAKGAADVPKEDYYVTHSRLVRFKRIDVLIEMFKSLKERLVIVGDGPSYTKLKKLAAGAENITFTGHIADPVKRRELLQRARGYVYASFEDFGISPVEALSAGLPVLAYRQGGVAETVTPENGIFVDEQTPQAFISRFAEFKKLCEQYDPQNSISRAHLFDKERFKAQFMQSIESNVSDFVTNGPPVFCPRNN